MNIFSNLKRYVAGKWQIKSSRNFTAEEVKAVRFAKIVDSRHGLSVCFMMSDGGQTFIPLSNTSTLGVGEAVNLQSAKILTLEKEGEADILRIEA